MNFNELLAKLIYLTKKNSISNAEIGSVINLDRQSMSGRASRNTKFKDNEVELIEKYFSVNLSDIAIIRNSFKRHFDDKLLTKEKMYGVRILDIQNKNHISNLQMAGLLNVSETEYADIISGKIPLDLQLLNNIKQNFEVSADWLLYGAE